MAISTISLNRASSSTDKKIGGETYPFRNQPRRRRQWEGLERRMSVSWTRYAASACDAGDVRRMVMITSKMAEAAPILAVEFRRKRLTLVKDLVCL